LMTFGYLRRDPYSYLNHSNANLATLAFSYVGYEETPTKIRNRFDRF
jgi:hypothetical protein